MNEKERLREALNFVKESNGIENQSTIAEHLGYKSKTYLSDLLNGKKPITSFFLEKLEFEYLVSKDWIRTGDGEMLKAGSASISTNVKPPNDLDVTATPFISNRRKKKIESDPENDGIIYVPISAKAGYLTRFHDPIYLTQLERILIPGFPYRGSRYRVFDVEGDSMEPTLKEGQHVVSEKVDQDAWHQIADYYMYVVVLENDIIVKRLCKKDEEKLIAISDNEEFYPQFFIHIKDIKEIWKVKRKMDWDLAPPKRFEIKI